MFSSCIFHSGSGFSFGEGGSGVLTGAGGSSGTGWYVDGPKKGGSKKGVVESLVECRSLECVTEDSVVSDELVELSLSDVASPGMIVSALERETKRPFRRGCFCQARMDECLRTRGHDAPTMHGLLNSTMPVWRSGI
jgi:hypothetical protein